MFREKFAGPPPEDWGFGPMFGGHRHRGPRVKRGDVRAAALALLAEEPRNGYQIIQAIGERSGGVWRASPGSVYPALQQLEDEGLIAATTGEQAAGRISSPRRAGPMSRRTRRSCRRPGTR